jgi:choline-glycine betaine transporter
MSTRLQRVVAELRAGHQSSLLAGTLLLIAVVLFAVIVQSFLGVEWTGTARRLVLFRLGIVYPIGVVLTSAVLLFLLLGPWGAVVLGGDDAVPEYDDFTYFAMLFSVSLAAGVVFFASGEAMWYFETVPPGISADAPAEARAEWAIGFTLIHWGFFANYAHYVIAVPFAYYCYNRGAPMRISTAIYPFVRDRPRFGRAIDIVGSAAIVLGLATATLEVTRGFLSGVSYQWAIPNPTTGIILFVVALTLVFTTSTVTGLHRGIPRLSNVSVYALAAAAVGIFALGPTGTILDYAAGATLGQPAQYAALASNLESDWVSAWSIANWGIWFTGATSIGLFSARISYGRSIRELVGYACVGTALANMVWFYIIGGAVIDTHLSGTADIIALIAQQGFGVAGYPMTLSLPAGELFLFLFLGLGLLYLITSLDSMLFGLTMTVSDDSLSPPRVNRWFWGGVVGVATIVMTVVGGYAGASGISLFIGVLLLCLSVVSLSSFVVALYRSEETPALL